MRISPTLKFGAGHRAMSVIDPAPVIEGGHAIGPASGMPGLESGKVAFIGIVAGQLAQQGPCRRDMGPERTGRMGRRGRRTDHRTGG